MMILNKKHNEFEDVSCILCGKKNTRIVGRKGQFGFPVYVSICKNDGLVYLSPRWKKERYLKLYFGSIIRIILILILIHCSLKIIDMTILRRFGKELKILI
jgi:hypothetical protein